MRNLISTPAVFGSVFMLSSVPFGCCPGASRNLENLHSRKRCVRHVTVHDLVGRSVIAVVHIDVVLDDRLLLSINFHLVFDVEPSCGDMLRYREC